jgi:hypothetical protein
VIYLTIRYLLTVTQIELCKVQFPILMSDTKSLNTSLLEVMISSKAENVYIHGVSDHFEQIIFDACCSSMHVFWKRPICWNNSRLAPSWQFYVHWRLENTGSLGIGICTICGQILRNPSEHGTYSTGNHLLVKGHIAKLYELTMAEVTILTSSTVDESLLGRLNWLGTQGIPNGSSQRKIKFHIQSARILTELTYKML